MQVTAETLSQVPAFQQLRPATLRAMQGYASYRRFETGEVLRHQGDTAQCFFAVLTGGVRLVRYALNGQEVSLKIYGPGDVFGLLAVSNPFPSRGTVQAVTRTDVLSVLGEDIRMLMYEYPDLGVTITDLLVAHVHHAHQRLQEMATLKVDQRLAASLIELATKFGVSNNGHVDLDVPLAQQDLADFISSKPETVSRILSRWEEAGHITKGRKHICLCDQEQIARIAQGEAGT